MLRSAVRSTRRACATHMHHQQRLKLQRFSQTPARAALRAKHQSASPFVSQAMLLDRFGKQHRFDYHHHHDGQSSQTLAYWKAALAASGVCIASSLSGDSAAHAAPSKGSGSGGDKSASDLFEELKQKLQELSGEALQKLVPDEYKDIPKQMNGFLASGKGGQISWGFAMGVCSGFALKKVSKVGAVALGALFVLMQCANYSGYIDVDYKKLERDVMAFLDINKDGQFDSKDVNAVYQQVMKVLEFSLPAGSGYAVGFLIGFRAG